MRVLLIVNDPPYGTERAYNALRLAQALARKDPAPEVTIFLMADAVAAAKHGQKTPAGYYNIEIMLKRAVADRASVLLCGTCMDARGIADADIIEGARRSTMEALATATVEADKVLVF